MKLFKNKKNKFKLHYFVFLSLILILSFSGFSCRCGELESPEPFTLVIWNLWDDSDVYEDIIKQFEEMYPYITVKYYKKELNDTGTGTESGYELDLLEAIASDKGPDIFAIHNSWLPKYQDKLVAAPDAAFSGDEGYPFFKDIFVDSAVYDFQDDRNAVWGVPMSVDTLAMYYNKDILNSAGVAYPPRTWTEVKEAVKKITKLNENRSEVIQAGAALGTSNNITRPQDILSLMIMQQCGSVSCMTANDKSSAIFNQDIEDGDSKFNPGENALQFYTDFADVTSPVYTWNPDIFKDEGYNYAIDSFAAGKVGMMFNYHHFIPTLEKKNPGLNYDVAAMPQIKDSNVRVNYSNYWGFGVAKSSANQQGAWRFLQFLTNENIAKQYLDNTGNPTSMRAFYEGYYSAYEKVKVFVDQSLTAKSWYKADALAEDKILQDMITNVVVNNLPVEEALNDGVREINTIMEEAAEAKEKENSE